LGSHWKAILIAADPKTGYRVVPRSTNRLFTGRDEILERLSSVLEENRGNLDQQTRIAITGLGGLGKSELCLKLIEKVRGRYLDSQSPGLRLSSY
jgi:putative protein kinase ArgK-like GTPase of G3E family